MSEGSTAGLVLEDVRFAYPGGAAMRFDASVPAGGVCIVTGPSGSGKSTLLALVAGFETPDAGRVLIGGEDWTGAEPAARPLTVIFQEHNLFPHLDAATNVALGIAPRRRIGAEDRRAAEEALARVGLEGKAARLPGELSGGERQRAALARAVLRERPLLLLDEPFAALGPALARDMLALVVRIARERGVTVLLVTHQPLAATDHATHVLFLAEGRVHAAGEPSLLMGDDPVVRAYLHGDAGEGA